MPTWAGQWTAEPSKKIWRGGEEEKSERRGHSSRRQQHLHSFSPRSRGLMPFSSLVIFVLVWTSIIDVSAFQTSHPPPSSVGSVYKCWCPDVRRPVVISKELHQFPSYLSSPSRGVLLCALRITPLLLGSLSPWLSLSKHKGEEPPSGEPGKSARLSRGAKLDSNTAARLWTLRRSAKSTSSVSPRATTLELSGTWRASDNGDAGGEVIPKNAKTKSFDEACEAYPQRWRVEGEGKYEQTSSFRFLDGWAETFPSVVDASTGDGKLPTRIPFLFGTKRGHGAAMAILAPPDSTSLYRRIPFLQGSVRPKKGSARPAQERGASTPRDVSQTTGVGAGNGMGQDFTSDEADAEAVRQANRRTSEAIRAWKRERHDKDMQQLQQLQHQLPEKPATALPPQPLSPADGGADACVCGGGGGGEACGSCCNSEGFVAEDACSDVQIVGQAGRSIVKLGHSAHSSFALFSRVRDTGVSEWKMRVDSQVGVVFLGVLEEEHRPQDGLARKLVTPAWMLSNYGYVCHTGGPHGQVPLTEEAKRQVGDMSTGALAFEAGDSVTMRLDRDAGTLSFHIRNLAPFTLQHVSPRARPFVNLACRSDGVTLVRADDEEMRTESSSLPASPTSSRETLTEIELAAIRAQADAFWTS